MIGPAATWSTEAYLLALVADLLATANFYTASIHRPKNSRRISPPTPLQRPGRPKPTAPGVRSFGGQSIPKGRLDKLIARWRKGSEVAGG